MISSHNHTAAAAGHSKHSYLCQDTWDVIHRTGSQKALLHCICTPSGIHGQVIFTFCYIHFTELSQGTIMCSRLSAQCAASAPCCDCTKPLTITSHRAPLVHNSCTSHPSYLHACNNWGEQCHPTPSVTPNTSPAPAPAAPIITIHLTLDSGPGQALHQAGSQAVTGSAAKVLARADQWPM